MTEHADRSGRSAGVLPGGASVPAEGGILGGRTCSEARRAPDGRRLSPGGRSIYRRAVELLEADRRAAAGPDAPDVRR